MADRMRGLLKSSSSRLSSKTSMNHLGTTPYRFRIDIFISHVDNVKPGTDVCVTLERRGKTEATEVVSAKEKKVVFRQSLTLECTLFRRAVANKGGQSARASAKPANEEIMFDEKRAKVYLRKGGPSGKAIGKIGLNISDYVKGTSSTVFADMKLSDGSVIVTKIEATMIHMGKKKKSGSKAGDSDAGSEMTENDANSLDDSIFGDEEDLEAVTREEPPKSGHFAPVAPESISPITSGGTPPKKHEETPEKRKSCPSPRDSSGAGSSQDHAQPPSLSENSKSSDSLAKRLFAKTPKSSKTKGDTEEDGKFSREKSHRSKSKTKDKSDRRKEKEAEKQKVESATEPSHTASRRASIVESHNEVKELRLCLEGLKKENDKLKKANKGATEEIESLRHDLQTLEDTIEESDNNPDKGAHKKVIELQKLVKMKDKESTELRNQNKNLLDELEEQHDDLQVASKREDEIGDLVQKVDELKVALQREPEFVEVVNELKVAKLSLALANMEKEQAIFALQQVRQGRSRVVESDDDE